MSKYPTTIRLDEQLYKRTLREARKSGLSFSGVVHLLLQAFSEGNLHIGVVQYPVRYLESLEREAVNLRRAHRKGKARAYTSSKALFDDILER